jgi:hypothetical protein
MACKNQKSNLSICGLLSKSFRASKALVLGILSMLVIAAGCSTTPTKLETPQGARGDQFRRLDILGVLSRATSTMRRPNANTQFSEEVTVNVPPGTLMIIPAVNGWALGYGKSDPEDLSKANTFNWHREDHNLGLAQLSVFVTDIDAVDTSTTPPTQTAKIRITAMLSDDNGDDQWFGAVDYKLLCLGNACCTNSPSPFSTQPSK